MGGVHARSEANNTSWLSRRMAEGLTCSVAGCGFVTSKVPDFDDMDMQDRVQVHESHRKMLQLHESIAHNSNTGCQFTPTPVTTAATASTATIPPASMASQLRVPAPQVGQIDPISIGSTVTQPTMSGQPFILSQHTWPSLPAHLEKIIPTARTDTKADVPRIQGDVSDVLVARPEEHSVTEADNMPRDVTIVPLGLDNPATVPQEGEDDTAVVKMDCDAPIKAMTTGLRCVVGQDCVQRDMVVNAEIVHVDSDAPTMTRQMDQLHKGFVDENADDTAATVAELGDANGTTVP